MDHLERQLQLKQLSKKNVIFAVRMWVLFEPFLSKYHTGEFSIQEESSHVVGYSGFQQQQSLNDIMAARLAWAALVRERRWKHSYVLRARSSLLRALEVVNPVCAQALTLNVCSDINLSSAQATPTNTKNTRNPIMVFTESSHDTCFFVHDCLPRTVRRLATNHPRYQLLALVVYWFTYIYIYIHHTQCAPTGGTDYREHQIRVPTQSTEEIAFCGSRTAP